MRFIALQAVLTFLIFVPVKPREPRGRFEISDALSRTREFLPTSANRAACHQTVEELSGRSGTVLQSSLDIQIHPETLEIQTIPSKRSQTREWNFLVQSINRVAPRCFKSRWWGCASVLKEKQILIPVSRIPTSHMNQKLKTLDINSLKIENRPSETRSIVNASGGATGYLFEDLELSRIPLVVENRNLSLFLNYRSPVRLIDYQNSNAMWSKLKKRNWTLAARRLTLTIDHILPAVSGLGPWVEDWMIFLQLQTHDPSAQTIFQSTNDKLYILKGVRSGQGSILSACSYHSGEGCTRQSRF